MHEVWADSLSLAATQEVAVAFLSCRYLDVSVPCVALPALYIQAGILWHNPQ